MRAVLPIQIEISSMFLAHSLSQAATPRHNLYTLNDARCYGFKKLECWVVDVDGYFVRMRKDINDRRVKTVLLFRIEASSMFSAHHVSYLAATSRQTLLILNGPRLFCSAL